MKKIYTLVAAVAVVLSANAQTKSNVQMPHVGNAPALNLASNNRAMGDTLFAFDGSSFWGMGISASSTPPFNYANEDIDGKTINAAVSASFGTTSAFKFFYSLNSVTGDTMNFIGATSYFAGAVGQQADNWFEVGPITIPAAGATLNWKHNMPDGAYRDGYKVLVSTTGMSNYTDFTDPAIFTVADNSPSTTTDTAQTPDLVFYPRSASLAAYAGQDIYIAFHHNAVDQFILYLDDITVLEGATGIAENEFVNGVKLFQNVPNPSNGISRINYELQNASMVAFNVYDVTGKLIASQNEGNVSAGTHAVNFNSANLSAGVYYYSLNVNNNVTAAKKMVVIK